MTTTITIPLTFNGKATITGTPHGPFIVHRNVTAVELDFEEFPTWSVTHVKTGMRFPWVFMTEESAAAFSVDVLPVMPWDDVEATIPPTNHHVATWGMNKPTKEQKDAVRGLAAVRGGFKAAVRTVQS